MTYVLLTDETNQRPSGQARFFIYGGVFFPADDLADIHALVKDARDEAGYESGDKLKFDTRSRPAHVTRSRHTAAKQHVLEGCAQLDVTFVAYLILHDIARNRTIEELVGFGLNTVLSTFQRFLERAEDTGVCLVDRLPFRGGHQWLEETYQHGLLMQNNRRRALSRVLLLGETTQTESFVASAVDVVLGSFRYCINERANERVTRSLLPPIVEMMWSHRVGDTVYLREYGLMFRPLNVAVPAYRAEYSELTDHFTRVLQ